MASIGAVIISGDCFYLHLGVGAYGNIIRIQCRSRRVIFVRGIVVLMLLVCICGRYYFLLISTTVVVRMKCLIEWCLESVFCTKNRKQHKSLNLTSYIFFRALSSFI